MPAYETIQPVKPLPFETTQPVPAAAKPAPISPGPPVTQPTYTPGDFSAWATSRYGRAPTAAEFAQIGAHVGAPTAGGAYSEGQWTQAQTFADQLAAQMGWKAPGTATTTPSPAGPVDPGVASASAAQAALQQLIATGQLPSLNANIDTTAPAFVAQRSNFDRTNAAAATRARLAAGESAAASNTLGSGGFDADKAGAENAAADRKAQFEADLFKGELDSQRSRVMQALDLATKSGDSAMTRQLQEKLALLDNQLRSEALKTQTSLGRGQLSLGLLQALMGNQQAKDALGFNYASLGVNANQNWMNAILNGL